MSSPGINLILGDDGSTKTAMFSQQENMPELTLFADSCKVARFKMNQKNAGRAVNVSKEEWYRTVLVDLHRSTV